MKRCLSILLSFAICLTLLPAAAQVRAASVDDLSYYISNDQVTITDCNEAASGSLTIPDTIEGFPVTGIWYSAFSYCSSLTSVTIPDSVTSIGDYAFNNCSGLTSVTIPDSVNRIGNGAFEDCSSLTSVTIPDSVTSIGYYAFRDCSGLTGVTIPDSVTSIGYYAFSGCESLTGIVVSENNPSYSSDSCGVLYTKDKTTLIQAPGLISGHYTIPDGVTSIGNYAFCDCSSLTGVTIPDSVTSFGEFAFAYCSLTSVTIPDSITNIRDFAFHFCSSLTSVTIPNSVTSIGGAAFGGCGSLTSVTIPDSVTSIGVGAFANCGSLTSVTIPGSVTSIGDYAFNICPSLTGIVVSENNPSYSSDSCGVLYTKDKATLMQAPGLISGHYTIPDGVTSIGNSAFQDCSSLTSVTIPDSVTSIGDEAFYNCSSLTNVYFTGNAPTVESGAFYGVTATAYYHAGTSGWEDADPEDWTLGRAGDYDGQITLQEVDHIWSEDGTCLYCGKVESDANCAELTGKLTAFGEGEALLILTPVGETTPVATQKTTDGSYSFCVEPGEYILTVSQEGTATRTYTVTLTEGETALDVKLQRPGDVTGDGKLNVGDVAKIYAHSKRSALLTDDYQLICADYNGDGRINVGDTARVYGLIKS